MTHQWKLLINRIFFVRLFGPLKQTTIIMAPHNTCRPDCASLCQVFFKLGTILQLISICCWEEKMKKMSCFEFGRTNKTLLSQKICFCQSSIVRNARWLYQLITILASLSALWWWFVLPMTPGQKPEIFLLLCLTSLGKLILFRPLGNAFITAVVPPTMKRRKYQAETTHASEREYNQKRIERCTAGSNRWITSFVPWGRATLSFQIYIMWREYLLNPAVVKS